MDLLFWSAFSFMALVLGARAALPILAPKAWLTRKLQQMIRVDTNAADSEPEDQPSRRA